MIERAIIRLNIDYKCSYDLFSNGKLILLGKNSSGKSTILKSISNAINSKNAGNQSGILADLFPIQEGVDAVTIFLTKNKEINLSSIFLSAIPNKDYLINIIQESIANLSHNKIIETLEFFNNKYKKHFSNLLIFYRDMKLTIERDGYSKKLKDLSSAELKLLSIYFILKQDALFLICDDVDVGFHVNIQNNLIKNMLEFLEYRKFSCPFLVSTHSPSIIIYNENIIQEISETT